MKGGMGGSDEEARGHVSTRDYSAVASYNLHCHGSPMLLPAARSSRTPAQRPGPPTGWPPRPGMPRWCPQDTPGPEDIVSQGMFDAESHGRMTDRWHKRWPRNDRNGFKWLPILISRLRS